MRYEEVKIGDELLVNVRRPTTIELVKYAAATGDYYQVHYDKDFAVEKGLPGVIVQGGLVLSYLGQMVMDWVGDRGKLEKIKGSYRGVMNVNEEIFCHGEVAEKREGRIALNLWAEDAMGDRKVTGKAVLKVSI